MLGEKLMTLRKKHGYSQQEVADMLSVTRQTISNWESDQGAPSLDKARELAEIYKISLDDLAGSNVEVVAANREVKDSHVLKRLIGRTVRLDCSDMDLMLDGALDLAGTWKMKILDVNDEWLKVEYERTRDNSLFQKENVIKLIEMSAVNGFEFAEEGV